MKNIISSMTNLLDAPNSRLDLSNEKMNKPDEKEVEIIQIEHKGKRCLNKMNNNKVHGTMSSS